MKRATPHVMSSALASTHASTYCLSSGKCAPHGAVGAWQEKATDREAGWATKKDRGRVRWMPPPSWVTRRAARACTLWAL
jgi:hypothetical protein